MNISKLKISTHLFFISNIFSIIYLLHFCSLNAFVEMEGILCQRYGMGRYYKENTLLYAETRVGNRPSFEGNISTLGLMVFRESLPSQNPCAFVDLNWSSFGTGNDNGFSGGAGIRYSPYDPRTVLGLNGYFDYLGFSSSSLRQASVGFEWLTFDSDFRINAYFPVERNTSAYQLIIYDDYIGDYIVVAESWEKALRGFDLEFRRHFYLPYHFRIAPAIGGYFLSGGCCDKNGIKGSLAFDWRDLISIEGAVYYDKCNQISGEAIVRIEFPLESYCAAYFGSYCHDWKKARVRRCCTIPHEQICNYVTNY